MLADTHTHLYWDSYRPDLDAVIQRASEKEVQLIINVGTDIDTSKQAVRISDKLTLAGIKGYSTVGIHPHNGQDNSSYELIQRSMDNLESLYSQHSAKIVAIGECGLDYFREHSKKGQLKLYRAQVELAKRLNLPLIIHCREAWQDIFIPELKGTRGVLHNFSGSAENARKALALGYYLSFSCILTYPKNEGLKQLAASLPLDKILTETDCPFLPPQQIRGERNEPAYIPEVVQAITEASSHPYQKISQIIWDNTHRLFDLS